MSSAIVRDPRFSMSMWDTEVPTIPQYRQSYGKRLERRFISIWKIVTRATRKQQRASMMHPDFVMITSRRKSIMHPQLYNKQ